MGPRSIRVTCSPWHRGLLPTRLPGGRMCSCSEGGTGRWSGQCGWNEGATSSCATGQLLKLLMVDPERQGQGLGTRLVDACLELARDLGIEQVYLSARSATGLEEYYAKIGWQGVGRFPGGVRVAAGDDRDEVWFFKRISP